MIGFLRGELGAPPGGWPEPLRTRALAGRGGRARTSAVELADEAKLQRNLDRGPPRDAEPVAVPRTGPGVRRRTANATATPSGCRRTRFFYGLRPGEEHRVEARPRRVTLLIGLEAISEADERGMRTVMCLARTASCGPVQVRDRSTVTDHPAAEQADRSNPATSRAPFAGAVSLAVAEVATTWRPVTPSPPSRR